MRPVLKAFASDHPVVVFFAVLVRWAGWTVVGNPVAVLAAAVAAWAGAEWEVVLLVALAALVAMTGWGMSGWCPTRVRWVWLWWRMCRFRLRWPTVMAAVNGSRQTVIAKALPLQQLQRPRRAPTDPRRPRPRLAPTYPGHRRGLVGAANPRADPRDLAERVDRISATYRIVDRVDVDYRRSTDHRGRLVVSFADELVDVREPAWA